MEQAVQYGAVARACHWLTVALLLAIVPMGLVMGNLPRGELQDTLFRTHESLGISLLALTALRLAWRLTHRPPPPSASLTPFERQASAGVHALLYLLLLLMPVSGYLFISLSGIDFSYFGLIDLPSPFEKTKPLADLAMLVHASLQWVIYGLAALHVAAALQHFFVRRDDVLPRMLPALRAPRRRDMG